RRARKRGARGRGCGPPRSLLCGCRWEPLGRDSARSDLASHALAHAAEGRLYQEALLDGAEAAGLEPIAVARASIWDEACWTLGVSVEELKRRIGDLRREVGAPWAEDQKLAALAAPLALAAPA